MTKFLYRNATRRKFVIKFISEKATEIQGAIVEYLTGASKTGTSKTNFASRHVTNAPDTLVF